MESKKQHDSPVKEEQKVSVKKAIIMIASVIVVMTGAGLGVGYAMFWDKPVMTSQDDYELKVAYDAVKNSPMNPAMRLELGWQYTQRQEYEKALTEFQNVLKMDKEHVGAKVNIAIVKGEQGKIEEAIKILEEVKEKNPTMIDARYVLGQAYEEKEDFKKAIEEYEFVYKANPGIVEYIVKLGDVYRKLGDSEEAERLYKHAIARLPDYEDALKGLELLEKKNGTIESKEKKEGDQ